MPRRAKAPSVRSDGEMSKGSLLDPTAGQPNSRPPRGAVTQAAARAGAGTRMPYGEAGQLASDAAATPPATAQQNPLYHAVKAHLAAHPVTPLFAPTERPWEHVTAGAPLAPGPTNPLAVIPQGGSGISVANILQQAADMSQSPTLRALAAQAQAVSGSPSGPNPFGAPTVP